MKKLYLSIIFILFSIITFSQSLKITGKVVDKNDKLPLPGANIVIVDSLNTDNLKGTTTDKEGLFSFNSKKGTYKVRVSFIGYNSFERIIHLNKKAINFGTIFLDMDREMLNEVKVERKIPPTIQKGDTTQFNAAAFKTNPDASAKEMVLKMPGFMIVDGKILFQGEEIKQVLIDDREFFGKEAIDALINIPVDIIKSIKVYEYQSEQAKFTGFKDFTQAKTINIITKNGFHNLTFGEVGISGGNNNEYSADGSINIFAGDQRMSANSRVNRYDSKDHRIKNRSKSFGFYYNNKINEKSEIGGNYSYRDNENKSTSEIDRTYISSELKGQNFKQNSISESNSRSQNLNLRWDYKINENNSFIFMPYASYSKNKSNSISSSETFEKEALINSSSNSNFNDSKSLNFNNSFLFFHRFNKKGRTISINVSQNLGNNDNDGNQASETGLDSDNSKKIIKQLINSDGRNKSFSTDITFTEKISDNLMARISYNNSYTNNHSDKKAFNIDEFGEISSETDIQTSKDYKNIRTENGIVAGVQYRTEKITFSLNSEYRSLVQKNKEKFPEISDNRSNFNQFIPSIRFRYTFKKGNNISFDYRSSVSNPSINQLQNVLDNTNPLFLRTGNPDLNQSRSHYINGSYSYSNLKTGSLLMLSAGLSFTDNYISNETIYARNDTTLNNGIFLPKGGQFSRPINMDGSISARSNITYGIPLNFIKSRLNFDTSLSYRRSPNSINSKKSFSNNYQISQGITIASNISEKLDFNLSSRSSLSFLDNSGTSTKSKRLTQSSNLRFFWNPIGKLIMRTNLRNIINDDLKGDYYKINWTWDMSIGTKLFKKRQGEISITARDLLNNKDNIYHYVSDLYIQDSKTSVVNRYYLIKFSYRFR